MRGKRKKRVKYFILGARKLRIMKKISMGIKKMYNIYFLIKKNICKNHN